MSPVRTVNVDAIELTQGPGHPDSDKISVAPGSLDVRGLNALRLPRSSAVDYCE